MVPLYEQKTAVQQLLCLDGAENTSQIKSHNLVFLRCPIDETVHFFLFFTTLLLAIANLV